jgi:hypothetical protein
MTYFFRQSRIDQIIRALEVIVDLAILAGLILLAIKLWPAFAVVFKILNGIAHLLGC